MEFTNDATAQSMRFSKDSVEKILVYLSIMAPNIASELLELLLDKKLEDCTWPSYDPVILEDEDATIVVQVNGKLRANIQVKKGTSKESVQETAEEAIERWLENKKVIKVVIVPDKLINFVVH